MSLPTVAVEVSLIGLAVESLVEFVLDKTGVVVKVDMFTRSPLAVAIKAVKTHKTDQMA